MQTVLKELELFIENQNYHFLDRQLLEFANKIQDKVKELQPKEKQLLKDAFLQGDEYGFHSTESKSDYETESRSEYISEKYFNETFKND